MLTRDSSHDSNSSIHYAHPVVDLGADDLPARDAEVPLQHPAPSRLEGELLLDLLNLVQRPLQILGPP